MSTFSINSAPGYPFVAGTGSITGAISTSTTSASAAMAGAGDSVMLSNNSTGWAFVTFTTGTVAVVKPVPGTPQAGVYPIPPNSQTVISLVAGRDGKNTQPANTINALADTGTGTIYFAVGSGA